MAKYLTVSAGNSYEVLLEDLYVNGYEDSPAMIWLSLEGNFHVFVIVHIYRVEYSILQYLK